ncbi:hypothetical protein [Virgibacillus litoralis]|uniref:Lipoprotein n=1 Tax=Virgibacillus litoralis TaxID=578221 RepID=A0ABS4H8I0_9BACI|nr:hypothetical protein [Virgibacillus litoralis]MBP1947205.1 hypothetical protein [Virgibacillus litoralis]
MARKVLIVLVLVFFGISLVGCSAGSTQNQHTNIDEDEKQAEVKKILEDGIGHHVGIYENLPKDIKTYLKKKPEMLKELVQGPDPRFMAVVDAARYHLDKVEIKDIVFLYKHKEAKFSHLVENENGEEPPAMKIVVNKDLIEKLNNN